MTGYQNNKTCHGITAVEEEFSFCIVSEYFQAHLYFQGEESRNWFLSTSHTVRLFVWHPSLSPLAHLSDKDKCHSEDQMRSGTKFLNTLR